MGEVTVVPHVGGLDARNAAQRRVKRQGSTAVVFSVLIEVLNTSCEWSLAYKMPLTQHSIIIPAIADIVK